MNGSADEVVGMSCAECGAENPAGTAFCTQCGVKLSGAKTAAGRRRKRGAGDAAERSRARQEFGRIKQTVLTVRSVFWACAALAAVQLLAWHLVAAEAEIELSSTVGLVITVLLWGQLGLVVAGAVHVLRAPLVWTTIGACYWSLNSAVMLLAADGGPGPLDLVQAFLAVAFWFAVAQAARVQRFMAVDPSLQLVRKRLAPEERVAGGVADQARARDRRERRAAWRGRLRLIGVAALVLVLGGYLVWKVTRPTPVDATLRAFGERWSLHDVDGICGLFDGGAGGSQALELRQELEQRGWLNALPRLADPAVEARGDRAAARWAYGADAVQVLFARARDAWHVARVTLPPVEAPAPTEAVEAFVRAWAASGTDELVAMIRPASQERVGGGLRRILERREWSQQRPALGAGDVRTVRDGRCRVGFALDGGELRVNFEYWHPRWRLSGVTLPQR